MLLCSTVTYGVNSSNKNCSLNDKLILSAMKDYTLSNETNCNLQFISNFYKSDAVAPQSDKSKEEREPLIKANLCSFELHFCLMYKHEVSAALILTILLNQSLLIRLAPSE